MSANWIPPFKKEDVIKLGESLRYSGFSTIKQFHFQIPLFNGKQSGSLPRELCVRPNAVGVLLFDPKKSKIVLIEQFRPGALEEEESPWLLEIVAGLVDEQEDLMDAAVREVKEETGCDLLSLSSIGTYYTSPGFTNEKMHLFFGLVNAPENGGLHGIAEEGEDIRLHIISKEDVFKLLEMGKIISSPALVALQWLKINEKLVPAPQ